MDMSCSKIVEVIISGVVVGLLFVVVAEVLNVVLVEVGGVIKGAIEVVVEK